MAEARWEHIQSTRASADINWTLASGFWMKRYGFFCWYWRKSFSCSRFSTWLEAGMYYLRDLALKRKRICFTATSWIETSNATEIFLKTNSVHTYYKNLHTSCFSASTGHLKKPPQGWPHGNTQKHATIVAHRKLVPVCGFLFFNSAARDP